MSTPEKYNVNTIGTLLSIELNSLLNNSLAIGPAYDNIAGSAPDATHGDGSTLCDIELVVRFGVAPTANTGIPFWWLAAPDGVNYEDGSDGTTTPARIPDCVFPLRPVTTSQRINRRIWMPWGISKPLIKNDGTGQSFAATLNTLKIRPVQRQV